MDIHVHPSGIITWSRHRVRCALGRGGAINDKREGDEATPRGIFPLRLVMYRPDRLEKPQPALPVHAIKEGDGWCDDPESPLYNTLVPLPCEADHELLWREDNIYDLIVVVGYNDRPPVRGMGSAIFLHLARPAAGDDYERTKGCVALKIDDLKTLIGDCDARTRLLIAP